MITYLFFDWHPYLFWFFFAIYASTLLKWYTNVIVHSAYVYEVSNDRNILHL